MWDATCSDTFAAYNIQHAVREARAVAVEADHRKRANTHIFTPVSVETSGACGAEALYLFHDIVGRISSTTKDLFALSYLLQQVSVAIQRGNAAAVLSEPTGRGRYRPQTSDDRGRGWYIGAIHRITVVHTIYTIVYGLRFPIQIFPELLATGASLRLPRVFYV